MSEGAKRRREEKAAQAKQMAAARAHEERMSIRAELQGRGVDVRGTSSAALGAVKAASEEARHVTCSECGYGSGRHARICSRAS